MSTDIKWARMPVQWVRDKGLRQFRKRELAASIAALKIYVVLCLHANRAPTPLMPEPGCAQLTYDDLEKLTGLARATIVKGISKLNETELINTSFDKKKAMYKIVDFHAETGWAKIPHIICRLNDNRIKDFSARSKRHLDALKLYILILCFRQGKTAYASIGYDKITQYTGVFRENIRKSISILIEFGLIVVDKRVFTEGEENNPNMYYISGLGMPPRRHDRDSEGAVNPPLKL